MQNPPPNDVFLLRERVRGATGITAAIDQCAATLHTTRRVWRQWETGERKMHPAFWELARLKLDPEKVYVDYQELLRDG